MKMKHALVAGLAVALLVAGQALAQTCDPNIPATAPDSRYTDHGDGTLTDNATGLMWKQCAEGLSGANCTSGQEQYFSWSQALQQGQGLTFAGHSDWRLPNIKELSSLVEECCLSPAINLTRFPNASFNGFWSSSPIASYSNYAWVVDFYSGYVDYYYRYVSYAVRLVRGGQ